jgi:hypothetical protein
MAVSHDAVIDAHSGKSASSLTFDSASTASGATLLTVIVTVGGIDGAAPSVSSVTYGGTGLTHVKSQTSGLARIELWRLISPASGVNSIVVTLTGATDSSSNICAGATTYLGSDTTTPLGTAVSASGSSTTPTVNVTDSAVDDLVMDGVVLGSATSPTAGAGQTKRWEELVDSNTYGDNGCGSTEAGASGTVTMSWTVGDDAWGIIAVTIKQGAVLTLIATASAYNTAGAGTVLDVSPALDIQAGDFLVAFMGWEDVNTYLVSIDDSADDSNSMYLETVQSDSSLSNFLHCGYKLAATAKSGSTMRFTLNAAADWRFACVKQYRPTAGYTVSKVTGPSENEGSAGEGGTVTTGNVTFNEAYALAVAAQKDYRNCTPITHRVDSINADSATNVGTEFCMWVKSFTTSKTGINGTCILSGVSSPPASWEASIIVFKMAAAGAVAVMIGEIQSAIII